MPPSATIAVSEMSQVGEARRTAVRVAEQSGLPETERGQVAIVATELATNLARYAKDGRLFVQSAHNDGTSTVQLLAVDAGPGIADVAKCLQDGFSSGGTPGTGLGAVKRLSDDFDVYSTVGSGTIILSRVIERRRPRRRTSTFVWAALSTPAPGETVCGDTWRIRDIEGGIAIMVADGLGHGPSAADAAEKAAAVFDASDFDSPKTFCERAHEALSGSRGAALAMADVAASGAMRYAGTGNISGALVQDGKSRGLPSQNGTAGVAVRRVQQFDYDWRADGVLVMHSDGLTSRWSLDAYPGIATRDPAMIAGALHRDCARGRDDATIVVVKRR